MKTIVIIGGMGPQASLHANDRLNKSLKENCINANVVHISLEVVPFFNAKPELKLTKEQKSLLKSIKADVGFISCNTAHLFFDVFQDLVNFPLVSMIDSVNVKPGQTVYCSNISKEYSIFGSDTSYYQGDRGSITELIEDVYEDRYSKKIIEIVKDKNPIFGCTEVSLLARRYGIVGVDTLEETIKRIIKDI